MAVLAKTPIVNARMLIHDPGPLGLRSLYLRANLPEKLFPAFRVAIDVARETHYDGGDRDRERYVSRMIERILTQYENVGRSEERREGKEGGRTCRHWWSP